MGFCALIASAADAQTSTTLADQTATTNAYSAVLPYGAPASMPAQPLTGTSQLSVPAAVPAAPLPPLLQWGSLAAQAHLLYRFYYADGLHPLPGQKSSSFINEVDPGLLLQWGRHWTLDYTPILRFYTSSRFRDTFDNSVILTGGTSYGDWSFGLSQSYVSSSDPLVETAAQLDQQTYVTSLSATRQLGSQTSLELGAGQSFRFLNSLVPGELLSDSRSWSTMDWLNYQFWSRFGAAIGVGFGYDNLAVGPDMTSEQFQGRISWRVVDKLRFVVAGGGEDRQFLSSGAPNLISPIFSLSAQYSPFEVTTLTLTAFRAVSPSFYQDQVSESTSVVAGLHQRLLSKLYLDLNGGYGNNTYHASNLVPVANNTGNYDSTFFSARLGTTLLKRGSAAAFYSVNYNSSGAAIYNYTTTQVGLELSYRY